MITLYCKMSITGYNGNDHTATADYTFKKDLYDNHPRLCWCIVADIAERRASYKLVHSEGTPPDHDYTNVIERVEKKDGWLSDIMDDGQVIDFIEIPEDAKDTFWVMGEEYNAGFGITEQIAHEQWEESNKHI